jgi:hypothetical protein
MTNQKTPDPPSPNAGTAAAKRGDLHAASIAFTDLVDGTGHSLLTNMTGLPDYDDIRKDETPA